MSSAATGSRCCCCSAFWVGSGGPAAPVGFDADPLHTKNPNTRGDAELYDLGDSPLTNPFTIDIPGLRTHPRQRRWLKSFEAAAGSDVLSINACAEGPGDKSPRSRQNAQSLSPAPIFCARSWRARRNLFRLPAGRLGYAALEKARPDHVACIGDQGHLSLGPSAQSC